MAREPKSNHQLCRFLSCFCSVGTSSGMLNVQRHAAPHCASPPALAELESGLALEKSCSQDDGTPDAVALVRGRCFILDSGTTEGETYRVVESGGVKFDNAQGLEPPLVPVRYLALAPAFSDPRFSSFLSRTLWLSSIFIQLVLRGFHPLRSTSISPNAPAGFGLRGSAGWSVESVALRALSLLFSKPCDLTKPPPTPIEWSLAPPCDKRAKLLLQTRSLFSSLFLHSPAFSSDWTSRGLESENERGRETKRNTNTVFSCKNFRESVVPRMEDRAPVFPALRACHDPSHSSVRLRNKNLAWKSNGRL